MSPDLSNRFDHPLRLEPGHSPRLLKVLVCLHVAGAFAWLISPLSPAVRALAIGVLLVHFGYLHRRHVRPVAARAVRALYWERGSGWHVKLSTGWYPATLCYPCYVTAALVAARFRIGRLRRVSVIVVDDRVDADSFRRLRVRLLQCAHGSGNRTQVSGQK